MSTAIRIYPNHDRSLLNLRHWIKSLDDPYRTRLWIDSNQLHASELDFSHDCWQNIDQVCFYDFFHAHWRLSTAIVDQIRAVSARWPTTWYTGNCFTVPGIDCMRLDHMWNRCRAAYLDGIGGWKMLPDTGVYRQWPMRVDPRPYRYLSANRLLYPYRGRLVQFLREFPQQHLSSVTQGLVLGNSAVSDSEIVQGRLVPPDRHYFDTSYISCQVESQHLSALRDDCASVYFTEKTYDHLIQGRLVLNFGPPGYYRALEQDGWLLPRHIDLSWDSETHDETRFQKYLDCLRQLFDLPLGRLHDLFLDNLDVLEYNHSRLQSKPYSMQ